MAGYVVGGSHYIKDSAFAKRMARKWADESQIAVKVQKYDEETGRFGKVVYTAKPAYKRGNMPGRRETRVERRVRKALKKYVRRRKNAGPMSIRKHKKRLVRKEREGALSRAEDKTLGILRGLKGRRLQSNPPRVKGRKVKGGRAVTVRNFTGTIVKKADGTVQIVGKGRRK